MNPASSKIYYENPISLFSYENLAYGGYYNLGLTQPFPIADPIKLTFGFNALCNLAEIAGT